jgi:hypothetical protein
MCTRFTLRNAASCALHRRASRVVHVSALYFAYDGGTRLLCQRPRDRRTRLGLRLVKGLRLRTLSRADGVRVNNITAATAARRLELRPAHAPTPNARSLLIATHRRARQQHVCCDGGTGAGVEAGKRARAGTRRERAAGCCVWVVSGRANTLKAGSV